MHRIALVYSSKAGQTKKIARHLESRLQENGYSTVLIDADRETLLPSSVDGVIYGTPVYAGRYRKKLVAWVRRHREALAHVPAAAFTVTLNAADQRAEARATDDRLLHALFTRTGFVPAYAAAFAGALKYRSYSLPVKLLMRWISRRAGGDTDLARDFEYTRWKDVDRFLDDFLALDATSPFAVARRFVPVRAVPPTSGEARTG
jgi:menaquinone-dependent protoporphyrinogen oxidase